MSKQQVKLSTVSFGKIYATKRYNRIKLWLVYDRNWHRKWMPLHEFCMENNVIEVE